MTHRIATITTPEDSTAARSCPADYSFVRSMPPQRHPRLLERNENEAIPLASSLTGISILKGSVESMQQSLGRAMQQRASMSLEQQQEPVSLNLTQQEQEEDALAQDFQGVFHFEDDQ